MSSLRTIQNRLHKLKVEIMEIEESIRNAEKKQQARTLQIDFD